MLHVRISAVLLTVVFLGNSLSSLLYAGDSLPTPGEVLARHLSAIGPVDARAAMKTRVVQGVAAYRILVGGGGRADGKTGLVSEGHKVRFMMKFPSVDYRGENIVFNENAISVSFANSNQSRSPFAYFISTQDVIIRDGLLGGVLSTAWPLLELEDRKARLTVDGLKKVDGRQLYQVHYEPSKRTEAQILLYFDPGTFRHVKTVYSTSAGNNMGADVTLSSKLLPERSSLEERFADFKTVDGLTLPTHWNLHFTRELPDGSTTISEWDLTEDDIRNNVGLDPRNFDVK